MATAGSIATKEQILNVAERAIAQHGYAGTTLRSIVKDAGVNIAAVHYHFGSKEGLCEALINRIAQPTVTEQIANLNRLEASSSGALAVRDILSAYLQSSFEATMPEETMKPVRSQFIVRCRTEPEPMKSLAAKQFQESTDRYLDALQRSLPNQTRSDLTWKLDLVVTCLLRVLAKAGEPEALMAGSKPQDVQSAIDKLTLFLLAGVQSE